MRKAATPPTGLSQPAEKPRAGPKGYSPRPGQVICGELDMRIDRNGVWHYQGSPIGREALVRLFATVLRRDEAGDYWLITPAEIGRIEVEDAPFLAVGLDRTGQGRDQKLTLRTNVGKTVAVDADHPIRVDVAPDTGEPAPYVVMDGGVEARLSRAVFYELVDLGREQTIGGETLFGVWSGGAFFALGRLEAEA
jgi:uncharacterized protein